VTSVPARTIVICSGKGGVGKTTLTANLGVALARLGHTVSVLDADFGLRNLDLLLGLENRIVYTAQDVLAETCRLEQALVKHKQVPSLTLLPAGNPRMLEWLTPEDMQRIVSLLAERAEYVLIDAPAGVEQSGGVGGARRRPGDRTAGHDERAAGAAGAQPGATENGDESGDAVGG
jgi:septum site-determining protein MinD